jgi:polyisoprenyl-phosphate glycosyltransferase
LAYNGIFNFSEFPINFVSRLGGLTVIVALIYFISVVIKKFFFQEVIEGFTSLLFIIILFSGVQLIALGVIGEYVLRVFFNQKIDHCLL